MASNRKARLDRKTLLILGGMLGVETAACLGLGVNLHNRMKSSEESLKAQEKALANVRAVSASLPALQEQYAKMQAQVQFLESALPPAEYIPTLLGQVEQTARTCGVDIQEFRPKANPNQAAAAGPGGAKSGDASDNSKVQFDVVIRGNYRQIQRFLQSLTRFRKILALDSMTLNPSSTGGVGVSPVLTGNLSFTAYVLPPSDPVAPANPAADTTRNVARSVDAAQAKAASAAHQAAADRGLAPRDGADRT